ncbi:MAG: C2H2 type zinc finger domain-containing protein [Thermoplasmataceae archaeon]
MEFSLHFLKLPENSDSPHISWLNQNISKRKSDPEQLSRMLYEHY